MAKKAKIYTGTEWVDLAAATVDLSTLLPAGIVSSFAGSAAPEGYLLCDGSAVSRTGYARLFTAISTAYGTGDGSTTFNLPDLRGRVPAGLDNMGGTTASRITSAVSGITGTTLGASGGNENLHQHTHIQNPHNHNFLYQGTEYASWNWGSAFGSSLNFMVGNGAGPATSIANRTATNQNAGTGASQNVQPTLILNYIIKV
jgi:microcystin-dependent protein